jgi:hypothetical protein
LDACRPTDSGTLTYSGPVLPLRGRRFAYKGSDTAYVGVMAQEVQRVRPDAVVRGRDGYLRAFYDKLGLTFQTYEQWLASGGEVPALATR